LHYSVIGENSRKYGQETNMEAQERRAFERFDLSLPATVEAVTDQGTRLLNLQTRDVCAGGAYIHTDSPLAEGTEVSIDLVLDIEALKKMTGKHAFVKVSGRVIRSEPGGMAIGFDSNYKIEPID
jgi:hypothetical protein